MDKMIQTTLADVGEKRLVKLILDALSVPKCAIGGRGGDATAIDLGLGRLLAVASDRCPTPLAYKLDPLNIGVWGDLAITCVASDLIAAGSRPAAFLITLLLPRNLFVGQVVELMNRAESLAKSVGADIVAGDTKEATHLSVITTGIGLLSNNYYLQRRDSLPGDELVLTGRIGDFTAAHLAFERGIPRKNIDSSLMTSVYSPRPAFEPAMKLFERVKPHAGMDLSDGLLSTVFTLAEQSGLGINLKESAIPISQMTIAMAKRCSVEPLRLAFGTGDWQIAYSVSKDDWLRFSQTNQAEPVLYPIGEFTEKPGIRMVCNDGQTRNLRRIEQEHFLDSWADRNFLQYLLETPLFA